ncbi:histidinol-phosphate transaminase [Oceanobacillus manasiensis]|uniref:histidinol-phosphate transaminase n=1 Tax=Oceanobacillus manasiensis TaxID=586413 RepID=UPI0005AB3D9D|nr:histidinol-phosphate transaminase [Oceanobacillus manasiensis]
MQGKKILDKLTPYQQGKQMKEIKEAYGLEKIVKLSSNENPYGFSPTVNAFFKEQPIDFHIYPDGYTAELRTAIAEKCDVSENQILFGSGSEEIVQMLSRAFLYPGVNVIMPTPSFPQYKHNALIEGADIKEISTINGYHDLGAMLEAIDEQTNVIWLCSPNNPTGSVIEKEQLYDFLDKCPEHIVVALDEAYYEYMESEEDPEAIKLLSRHPNLIILRTFSKAYGLAGLRIGYGIANAKLIRKLDVIRGPFNTTSIAQKAALLALTDNTFIKETYSKNHAVRKSFEAFLDELGWGYIPSQTNFMLVSTPVSGMDVFQHLIERGFIVRPGELLGCPGTIRMTLGTEEDMEGIKQILKSYNDQLKKEHTL